MTRRLGQRPGNHILGQDRKACEELPRIDVLWLSEEGDQATAQFVGLFSREPVASLLKHATLDLLRDRLHLTKHAFAHGERATQGQNRHR